MAYVQKIFSGSLIDQDFRVFQERTGNSKRFVTGILVHPEGGNQIVTVTLRYNRGTKPVFRKFQFSNTITIDNIPYNLSKNFHPLSVPVQNDIITGSIESKGTGKVSIFLKYD